MLRSSYLLALTGSVALVPSATAQTQEDFRLAAGDGQWSDMFGQAVAVAGNRAMAGAPREDHFGMQDVGAIYVFERDASGSWNQVHKIRPQDGVGDDWLGSSVAMFGEWAVAGAPGDDDAGENAGSVYLFERKPNGVWEQRAKFVASDASAGQRFGNAVAMWGAGDRILVGGWNGTVYVYERADSSSWNEVAKLVPSEPDPTFGSSVSIFGKRALVGSPGNDTLGTAAGAAYVYERDASGAWIERDVIHPPAVGPGDRFGLAAVLHGDRALIGAHDDNEFFCCHGAAYILEPDANGQWIQTAKLIGSEYAWFGEFGANLALEGDRCVVGDTIFEPPGAAFVFERASSGAWSEVAVLEASDAQDYMEFGASLSISGDRVLVGRREYAIGGTGAALGYELGVGATYCQSTASSTGAPAILASVGSASVSANELSLTASPVPAGSGIFFLGPTQASLAFGNGTLCVGGSLVRLPVVTAKSNVHSQRLDLAAPPLAGNVVAGSLWNFQAWFRDPPAGGAFFNTSSALSILFEP